MSVNYQKGGKEVELASSFLNQHPELTVVYDIGANKGEWTTGVKDSVDRELDFYLFDAVLYQEPKRLAACPYANNFTVILSDENKTVDWYDRGPGGKGYGASYYKEVTTQYRNVKPLKREAVTLDALADQFNLPTPDFLKIDTQGSELDILKGASKLISGCNYIQLEVVKRGKQCQYGAPTYDEYLDFMKSIGFKLHSDNSEQKPEKPDHDVLFERVK